MSVALATLLLCVDKCPLLYSAPYTIISKVEFLVQPACVLFIIEAQCHNKP